MHRVKETQQCVCQTKPVAQAVSGRPVVGVDGNWLCSACQNVNYAVRTNCNRCHAPKPSPAGAHKRKAPTAGENGNWQCVECSNVNFAHRDQCNRCGAKPDAGMVDDGMNGSGTTEAGKTTRMFRRRGVLAQLDAAQMLGVSFSPYDAGLARVVSWMWNQWMLVTLAWYACAVFTAATLKRSKHRAMLSVFANLVIGWPLITPFAMADGTEGCQRLKTHWRKVLLIAVLAGLEKNLTNSSLSSIGGALKTALHGLNVVFTFFVAAIAGADDRAYYCIRGCRCSGNLLLTISLILLAHMMHIDHDKS
eukprot:g13553.t2